MKQLPTGVQVFERIRKAGALYVDKTDMIYNMISGVRMQFFLSRPRRFGKTLMCYTLNALFSGKRELFEGLAISKTDWAWESYPIIHLDMSQVKTSDGADGVRTSLINQTKKAAAEQEVDISGDALPGDMLCSIIVETSRKHGKPAVVIIDEYDSPFLAFFNDPPAADKVRDIMRDYYVELKANEPHIRFLFMTGISKFSKAGVFSRLNNLNDLSTEENYGTMLGYTEEELREYFSEYLEVAAMKLEMATEELAEKVRHHYNGFCFDGIHKVYCPFSILNFFEKKEFDNFWMESGSTKFIADYMKTRNLTLEQFRGISVPRHFASYPGEIEIAPPESFFYQAGYLTIREKEDNYFTLDYPNAEVLESMSRLVYKNMISHGNDFIDLRTPLITALGSGDGELLIETINRLLAGILYDDYASAAKQGVMIGNLRKIMMPQEWLYRSTILAFLRGCGVLTFGEMHNSQGRSDLLVIHRNIPWIIEIKVAKNDDCEAQAQEAMAQINGRQYDGPYKNAKKLAVAIDDKERQVGKWIEA